MRYLVLLALTMLPFLVVGPPPGAAQYQDARVLDILLVDIPAGRFLMGEPTGAAMEGTHWRAVPAFRLMRTEVTNFSFRAFIEATGYRTYPERLGYGYVFHQGRWVKVHGADWRHPRGPGSHINNLDTHPVVQVAQADAAAFCAWAGLRLPREDEWEYAARGADGRRFPWGNEPPIAQGQLLRANIGQPVCCGPSTADGFYFTAPVGHFPGGASPFGALDMAGNAWEWTATAVSVGGGRRVVMRGGGWGSAPDGVRVSIRHANAPSIGLDMTGFRCAGDTPISPGGGVSAPPPGGMFSGQRTPYPSSGSTYGGGSYGSAPSGTMVPVPMAPPASITPTPSAPRASSGSGSSASERDWWNPLDWF